MKTSARDDCAEPTIALGSRRRGDRALQTSCTAPSSDHVAAMIGSMYYTFVEGDIGYGEERDEAYLGLWRRRLGLAGELDDLIIAGRHRKRRASGGDDGDDGDGDDGRKE